MSIGAAIRITSVTEDLVIRHAAEMAKSQGVPCFIISVVKSLPYHALTAEDEDAVRHNLELIAELQLSPVMQEGDDIAQTLLVVACGFGVHTLFLKNGASHGMGRSIAEQLLYLDPPFDVVVVGSQ